jgi:hypothetical protein
MDGTLMNQHIHNTIDREAIMREERHAKKMVKAGMMAAFSGGIGFAIFILQRIFSGMAPDAGMNAMIDGVCIMLMVYAAVILMAYLFCRSWLLRANMVFLYAILPLWLFKLFGDHM